MTALSTLAGRFLKGVTRAIFRLFYEMEIEGLENVPREGRVIVAANHVNYFDAPMLLAFVPRDVHFVAAAPAFKVPVWASLMRLYGTISIERGRADAGAIKASLRVLEGEGALGIFPEGTFTQDGHLVEAKLGTAHLAIRSGAPIVPVTIAGAFHSWPRLGPRKRSLPRPWKIRIRFHPPIRVSPEEAAEHAKDKAFAEQLTARVAETLNRTLEPAIRAEGKIDELVARRAPRVRLYELFPVFLSLAAAGLLGLRSHWFTDTATAVPALRFVAGFLAFGLLYFVYLACDLGMKRQRAFTRALRSYSPVIFMLFYYPMLVRAIPLAVEVERGAAAEYPAWFLRLPAPWNWTLMDGLYASYFTVLVQLAVGLRFYHFNRYVLFQRYIRGLLLTVYAALLAILFVPGVGSYFPLIVPPESAGLLTPMMHRATISQVVAFSFPVVVVSLSLYGLAFDFINRRGAFVTLLLPALGGIMSAVVLRGYPLGFVAACAAFVCAVMVYMRLFPITGHDGRAV